MQSNENGYKVTCPRCGNYSISGTAIRLLETGARATELNVAKISHGIRTMQRANEHAPEITTNILETLLNDTLPSPAEKAENFVLELGRRTKDVAGHAVVIKRPDMWASIIGGINDADTSYITDQLIKAGLVLRANNDQSLTLSLAGWARYEELTRATVDTRRALMAMPFNNALLDETYKNCFKPAVAQTGFILHRIDENPPAGSIDDRLRVEIRRSRFLIAELTEDNSGAYWEAGFAEGLGRPVIYTCSKEYFDEKGTHFDTNHSHTIIWEPEKLEVAAERLKATIRATLPAEAKLEDDPE